jgi:hypothetical protein
MGFKVEQMTNGAFKSRVLLVTVAIGVGLGILIGVLIILFRLELLYFLIGGYGSAMFLTIFSHEDIVNIAWDSAGVTTGKANKLMT